MNVAVHVLHTFFPLFWKDVHKDLNSGYCSVADLELFLFSIFCLFISYLLLYKEVISNIILNKLILKSELK